MFNSEDERRRYSWLINQDGLWDIFLGLGILGLALDMTFGTSIWFIPLLLVGYSLALLAGKELITKPRIGNLAGSSQENIRMENVSTLLVILGLAALFMGGGVIFLQMMGLLPWSMWSGQYAWLFMGSLAAIGFSLLGYFGIGGKRYYLYSLLTFLALAVRQVLDAPPLPFVFISAVLLLIGGLALLLRFILIYPKVEA